jgi:hypothetical protein
VGSSEMAAWLLAEPAWSWLGEPQLPAGDQLGPALEAVTSRTAPCRAGAAEALCLQDPSIDELLDALDRSGYVPSSNSMRDALSDRGRWAASLAEKLADRLSAVEIPPGPGGRAPSDVLVTGLGLSQLWARRAHRLSSAPAFDVDPSSIPATSPKGGSTALLVAAHAIPYRVSLDVVRGGAAFSWIEPALRVTPWFSIQSIADLLSVEGSGRLASVLGLLPTFRLRQLGGTAIGVGFETVFPWNGDPVLAPGIVGRISLLQERMALSFGVRSLTAGHQDALVALSVSDLNGVAYWLALWATGRK